MCKLRDADCILCEKHNNRVLCDDSEEFIQCHRDERVSLQVACAHSFVKVLKSTRSGMLSSFTSPHRRNTPPSLASGEIAVSLLIPADHNIADLASRAKRLDNVRTLYGASRQNSVLSLKSLFVYTVTASSRARLYEICYNLNACRARVSRRYRHEASKQANIHQ